MEEDKKPNQPVCNIPDHVPLVYPGKLRYERDQFYQDNGPDAKKPERKTLRQIMGFMKQCPGE